MTFFSSIDRIPYGVRCFRIIERLASAYVLIASPEFGENFQRVWPFEMAKIGYFCLEKRTIFRGADLETSKALDLSRNRPFGLYLFKRIDPPHGR